MAIRADVKVELDKAYWLLAGMVEVAMEEDAVDIRAIIGAMGRLYIQLVVEEIPADERPVLAAAMTKMLTQAD